MEKRKARGGHKRIRSRVYENATKLLDLMDLSSNKLVGVIPEELCLLNGFRGLNLSHNHLSRNIPKKIRDLKLLDTLDLSNNNLYRAIPRSMSNLSSISYLNLSNNNLSRKIPTSNQLQTLIDPSIYAGNIQLCGYPLPKKCPGNDDPIPTHEETEHEDDKKENIWFWFIVVIGYATGLWAVIGTLVFKKNWRIAYFRFVDNTKERVLAMVAVKVARLKKMMQRTSEE